MISSTDAIKFILQSEGGYVNDKADKGGETYRGIARTYHPKWVGWYTIDQQPHPIKKGTIFPKLENNVIEFYRENFFNKSKANLITSSSVVLLHLFDMAVNSGFYRSAIILQKSINKAYKASISVDGQIGRTTLSYANRMDNLGKLEKAIVEERIAYYRSIGTGSNAKFLKGWLSRVENCTNYAKEK